MSTFLFDKIIFGPVKSRRLGISLGVNLLPVDKKFCNFDCLYCECGWTCNSEVNRQDLPARSKTREEMKRKILEMKSDSLLPDVITFAGNGEPTIHPEFTGIIEDTIQIRNTYCPEARIAVLSNATTLHKPSIVSSLKSIDQAILKLDTAIEETFRLINRPTSSTSIEEVIGHLENFGEGLIVQTLFFSGSFQGKEVDNSTDIELEKLYNAYRRIQPESIMIYTFERDTPLETLKKTPVEKLTEIADRIRALGIPVEISA